MPLPVPFNNFTLLDARNVALLSVPPISAALVGTLALQQDGIVFKDFELPKDTIISRDARLYLALNTSTVLPIGCATYLIWKNGGFDFADSRCAFALLGGTFLSGLAMYPAFKLGNFKLIAANSGLLALLGLSTSIAFGRIEPAAGYLTVPFAIWSLYCAISAGLILNAKKQKD